MNIRDTLTQYNKEAARDHNRISVLAITNSVAAVWLLG